MLDSWGEQGLKGVPALVSLHPVWVWHSTAIHRWLTILSKLAISGFQEPPSLRFNPRIETGFRWGLMSRCNPGIASLDNTANIWIAGGVEFWWSAGWRSREWKKVSLPLSPCFLMAIQRVLESGIQNVSIFTVCSLSPCNVVLVFIGIFTFAF